MTRKAVFLDRDGVLNRAVVRGGRPYPPDTLDDFALLPGVSEAAVALHEAGFLLVVVTNQPDVATGKQDRAVVEAMHARLRAELPLTDIYACYEVDGPACTDYKPKPGMLLAAARDHGIDLAASHMVGDRWRDVGAGRAAGCRTFFIDYGYEESLRDPPDHVVGSLAEAASIILRHPQQGL
ncbi:MAG TPA: HAD family hydrolase [Azospirillum sp.]